MEILAIKVVALFLDITVQLTGSLLIILPFGVIPTTLKGSGFWWCRPVIA